MRIAPFADEMLRVNQFMISLASDAAPFLRRVGLIDTLCLPFCAIIASELAIMRCK